MAARELAARTTQKLRANRIIRTSINTDLSTKTKPFIVPLRD